MNNRYPKNSPFNNDLILYIQNNNLRLQHPAIIDKLIENPDIKGLLSIWMKKNNTLQIQHVLVELPNRLSTMDSTKQESAILAVFERAKKLNDWMQTETNYDLAIQSVRERFTDKGDLTAQAPIVDRWSGLNRPLAELSEEDMAKLDKYAFYINGDIFNANTVLDMNPRTCDEFDAQVENIIKTHANFLLPDENDRQNLKPNIFTDELLDRLKKDQYIKIILALVPLTSPNPPKKAAAAVQNTPTNYDPGHINKLLGLEESDDDDDDDDDELNYSGLADQDIHSGDTDEDTQSEEEPTPPKALTFWQDFNIASNVALNTLVQLNIADPFSVPDRALTTTEEEQYAQALETINLKQEQLPQASTTSRESSISNLSETNSGDLQKPVRSEKIKQQQKFIPVIKDDTHNRDYKERNRTQRHLDYVTGKDLAKQQQRLKQRIPKNQDSLDVNSSLSSKSSTGYRKK